MRRRATRDPMAPTPTKPSLIEFEIESIISSRCSSHGYAIALPNGNSDRADGSRDADLQFFRIVLKGRPDHRSFFADNLVLLQVPHKLDAIVVLIFGVGAIKDVFGVCPGLDRV